MSVGESLLSFELYMILYVLNPLKTMADCIYACMIAVNIICLALVHLLNSKQITIPAALVLVVSVFLPVCLIFSMHALLHSISFRSGF